MAVRPLLVVLLVAGFATSAPAPQPRSDRLPNGLTVKNLQGTWAVLRYELAGRPLGATGMKVRINNETWAFFRDGPMTSPGASYKVEIDTSKKPAWLDLTQVNPKPFALQGIAKVEGDTLTVSFTVSGQSGKRPMEFTSTGQGSYLMVLKRDKP